jgi:hypothetical protein
VCSRCIGLVGKTMMFRTRGRRHCGGNNHFCSRCCGLVADNIAGGKHHLCSRGSRPICVAPNLIKNWLNAIGICRRGTSAPDGLWGANVSAYGSRLGVGTSAKTDKLGGERAGGRLNVPW